MRNKGDISSVKFLVAGGARVGSPRTTRLSGKLPPATAAASKTRKQS